MPTPPPAPVITNVGALGPFIKEGGEWGDTIHYQVSGAATRYAAITALNSQGYGYGSIDPNVSWLTGYEINPLMNMDATDDKGPVWFFETKYKRCSLSDPNPLNRTPLIRWSFGLIQEPCDTDYAGNTIANTAGDPFDPPQAYESNIAFLRETKYFSTYNVNTALTYLNTVNSAAVTISGLGNVPARSIRNSVYAPVSDYYANAAIIPVTFEFEYRPNGFNRQLANKGYQAMYKDKNGAIKKGKLINKGSLQPIPQPVLLDTYGIPCDQAAYTVNDPNKATDLWNHTQANTLPAYINSNMTPMNGAASMPSSPGGVPVKLPWRLWKETDFSYFATLGL